MYKLQSVIFALLISCSISPAQILNIEKYRQDKDTFNVWLGNINLGLENRKQKTSTLNYKAMVNLVYLSKKHSYMTINMIDYLRAGNVTVTSGYTHGRINFYRRKLFSYESFCQLQYDKGRGLEKRELAGFSFRLNFHNRDKLNIGFNSGVMYEIERWRGRILRYHKAEDSTRAETRFIKSTSNLYLRANLNQQITLFTITYYQARFDAFLKPRMISDVQIMFKVNRRFSFSNNFSATLDTHPIADNNKFIYTLSSSLILKFE
ncbi:MAG: DUF481 domain-containing protein [Cytophagaceae bacterium]|nr:DUF481 domain-containing protein [Cytophagaceae bacterium]MDW8456509.1 DUF481 domain-containing protein [Cytophagaceae bacterium]